MNWKQKICLWIGIILLVLATCFFEFMRFGNLYDYDWPEPTDYLVAVFLIGVLTCGLVTTFKDNKPKDEQNQKINQRPRRS